ncbi:alpha/beta hydrolase [Cryptosporangium minutisporangium]|uniref:Alpha/beta hydrolase n=1 Tax=Cryptosporangium minutisporangium TaxID=113569 RepID=A0ABP6SWI6_9ACTN
MTQAAFEFHSDGLALAGVLRVPSGAAPDGGWPALVFTGPLSGVKEQVVGGYAERLTAAGYVTLAFDHRNFGGSEGEPRQHEDSAGKLADLRDAVSALTIHPAVDADRIGAMGICLGGGYALRFAAFDPRVRAVACVAGGYNDPAAMRAAMGADGYRAQLTRFAEVAGEQYRTGQVQYLAAVSSDETEPAVMAGAEPFAYYGTERSASPGWANRLTVLTVRELITVDLAVGADFLGPTPLLVVHGTTDAFCSPDGARAVFERATGPSEILWLDTTNHIDLYDRPEYVDPAVDRAAEFFAAHL